MQYTTVLDASDKSFESIIQNAMAFEDSKILAAILSRDYEENDVYLFCTDLKISTARLEKEYLALKEFSKVFNKFYATNYNQCFNTALTLSRKLRSTISSTKKIFRKMCPVVRKNTAYTKEQNIKLSVFDHSFLTGLPYSEDMFGLENYPECVKDLCLSARNFFLKLTGIMLLCREIIQKERYIRTHPDLCNKIYQENYQEVAKKSHDTINAFKSLGTTLPIDAMSKRIHGPKSLQQAICDCFHVFNPSQFQLFVIFDTIEKGKKAGLTCEESILWPNNHDLAKRVRLVIEHFDELDIEGRYNKKLNKHHIKAKVIVMLMEWAGIIGSGKEAKFIKYFQNTYHGKYLVPAGNSGSNGSKNKFTEEEYAQFVEKIKPIINSKKEKAVAIPIHVTA